MSNDTVFVTGGTGFLGHHLVPALCRAGFRVRLLVRQPNDHRWLQSYPNVEVVQGDVLDTASLAHHVAGSRYLVHAAGMFRFWGKANAFEETNVSGTQNVLEAAHNAKVERLLHISTVYLLGNPPNDEMVDETYPPQPADPYQVSKLHAEQKVIAFHRNHQIPVVILRPGAFYGPLGQYAFNRLFFRDPMRGIIMQINRGRYVILPVYVPDVVQAIIAAFTKGQLGEAYNICDAPITHRAAYDVICKEANLWYPRIPLPAWVGINAARFLTALATLTQREPFYPINMRSYVYNYWRVSNEKARRELGFMPTEFREGARRTIAWYRNGQPEDIPETRC
jgi:nucleoside-diphosphate-sugar epimerase